MKTQIIVPLTKNLMATCSVSLSVSKETSALATKKGQDPEVIGNLLLDKMREIAAVVRENFGCEEELPEDD